MITATESLGKEINNSFNTLFRPQTHTCYQCCPYKGDLSTVSAGAIHGARQKKFIYEGPGRQHGFVGQRSKNDRNPAYFYKFIHDNTVIIEELCPTVTTIFILILSKSLIN